MDYLVRAYSRKKKVELVYIDVTETAKTLERRHLAGPAASKALAQALAGCAALSAQIQNEGECCLLQMRVDGPVGGLMAEATWKGGLRGYTFKKVLADQDAETDIDLDAVMGQKGVLMVVLSTPQRVIYSGQVEACPPRIQQALAKYYNESIQLPTAIQLYARVKGGHLDRAVGLALHKMAECETEDFVSALEKFNSREVREALATAAGLKDLLAIFDYEQVEIVEKRDLRFACRCRREKTLAALRALSLEELNDISEKGKPQDVVCHFCGETYRISVEEVRRMIDEKTT